MAKSLDGVLVVAISSRALFNFEEENEVFEDPTQGELEYMKLQWDRMDQPAETGVGFNLCQKLLSLNTDDRQLTDVVVLSKNDPVSGLRVFKSAAFHKMEITRGAFLKGTDPYLYLRPLQAKLFLSANPSDVRKAIDNWLPAAHVNPRPTGVDPHPQELRIAFDGDSVLFSDEAERIFRLFQKDGFMEHELEHVKDPLPAGPLQPFLVALHRIQMSQASDSPIKIVTALVTARGAPAHERALRTLVSWNVRIDQAFFLDGLAKTAFLQEFQPDFFFDDQLDHIGPAHPLFGAGHVPFGVANEECLAPSTDKR